MLLSISNCYSDDVAVKYKPVAQLVHEVGIGQHRISPGKTKSHCECRHQSHQQINKSKKETRCQSLTRNTKEWKGGKLVLTWMGGHEAWCLLT